MKNVRAIASADVKNLKKNSPGISMKHSVIRYSRDHRIKK